MNIDEIIQVINLNTEKKLTPLQETILRQTWEGKTYSNIADDLHYKQEYIRRVASHLWTLLSNVWQLKLGKNNFRCTLEPKQLTEIEKDLLKTIDTQTLIKYISYPDHPLSIDSPLYIERYPLEKLAKEEIVKPASLIRIKGPEKYGKNSLILRILNEGKKLYYHTVTIDFKQADRSLFSDIDKLLRWLSLNIARELNIHGKVEDYWNPDLGSKVSCSVYFQEAILEKIETPLVLALNEVNRLFEYPDLADDFFSLLRYWYEQGKRLKTWEKLRLIVAYSTDIYIPLNLNHSPFNIGLTLNLRPFNFEEVKILVERYGFNYLLDREIKTFFDLLGGHPYLMQITLYNLFKANNNQDDLTLEYLLNNSLNNKSIYAPYLQIILHNLKADNALKNTFLTIINTPNINEKNLDLNLIKKLDDMGLIIWENETIRPSCLLYVHYFERELSSVYESKINVIPPLINPDIKKNQVNNYSIIDSMGIIYNRPHFEEILAYYWRQLLISQKPLAIILCERDCCPENQENCTQEKKEECQIKIAHILSKNVRNSGDIVAHYEDKKLAIILPDSDVYLAFQIAAKIRDKVRALNITENANILGVEERVSVSLGLASLIPNPSSSQDDLINEARLALSKAKNNGGDQVTISPLFSHGLIDN